MATTGYSDTFNRTVSGGLGVATSGQTYTLSSTASQYSVAPSVATIAPSTAGDIAGTVDLQSSDVDISGQVALTAIPATNLATVGFVVKATPTRNYYYNATMMVATGGAISLRFSKVVSGGLSTITTVSTGLTYVANTFYNLRVWVYWSNLLQAHVLSSKLWAIGATEPGGWMATTTDNGLTQYNAGTNVGIFGRDESTTLGAVQMKIQNVAVKSYNLPMPATTDPMCNDPAITYPDQTALQSLAVAADAAMVTLDPSANLAALFPRVRISANSATYNTNNSSVFTFDTTEFNVGTSTNLSYDPTSIYLPSGLWLITVEVRLNATFANTFYVELNGGPSAGQVETNMRSSPSQNGITVGGTGHLSSLTWVTSPTTPNQYSVSFGSFNLQGTYTVIYAALSAVKISDYFT